MRAAVYATAKGGLDKNLKIESVTLPKKASPLPDGFVLVKTAFSSLNPVDYKLAESPASYFFANPKIPGLDFSGVAVDSRVPHVKSGDLVFGQTTVPAFGALAEYLVVQSAGVAVAPEGVKLEDVATIGVTGITAYQTMVPYIKAGDNVLINGASGGVGTYAIQIAKAVGAKVTAVCSGPNVALCKSLGADTVIDYKSVDLVKQLKEQGIQYDHLVDAAFSNYDLYWQAHHYLKPNAIYLTISGEPTMDFVKNVVKMFLLPGWLGGGQRKLTFISASPTSAELGVIAQWMKEGKVKAVLAETLPLTEVAKGYTSLKTARTKGKIVIKI